MWINKNIIQWDSHSEGGIVGSINSLNRTYELWNHANDILVKHSTHDYLSDAISNLNKAIGLRVKMLNENYHFNKSPFKNKDKKIYKQLEEFGILRPKLINEIVTFRNNIEHNDGIPPSFKKCQDFLEICWYFLKATDLYVIEIKDSFILKDPNSSKYWVSTEIHFDNNWNIYMSGWLKPIYISNSKVNDFMEIHVLKCQTRLEFMNTLDSKGRKGLKREDDERGEKPEDTFFRGQIISNGDDSKEIIKKYFKTIV